mmetsp:Transcript_48181/g.159675  ORF Transcript_48181/g.159675 Transcript_48181/m.159675 type:complete len:232 (-) Transcript_48181:613-1308(-)
MLRCPPSQSASSRRSTRVACGASNGWRPSSRVVAGRPQPSGARQRRRPRTSLGPSRRATPACTASTRPCRKGWCVSRAPGGCRSSRCCTRSLPSSLRPRSGRRAAASRSCCSALLATTSTSPSTATSSPPSCLTGCSPRRPASRQSTSPAEEIRAAAAPPLARAAGRRAPPRLGAAPSGRHSSRSWLARVVLPTRLSGRSRETPSRDMSVVCPALRCTSASPARTLEAADL